MEVRVIDLIERGEVIGFLKMRFEDLVIVLNISADRRG